MSEQNFAAGCDLNLPTPAGWTQEHGGRLLGLLDGGQRAAEVTLRYFGRAGLEVQSKSDDTPVTVADRAAETLFRTFVAEAFPDDAVLGEEHGTVSGKSAYRWVIDPIDGTKSFIGGVPLYSTLLALEFQGRPVAGGIWIPALGEMIVAAEGLGCWYRPTSTTMWKRAAVSSRRQLSGAIFVTTAIDSYDEVQALDRFLRLQESVWFTRTWGDGYGYLLVATGRADLMVDPIVNPWDVAAIRPIIEEAGGRFSDWSGVATTHSTHAIGSNGHLHESVLAVLR